MSSSDLAHRLAVSAPGVLELGIEAVRHGATPYAASSAQAAAALVQLSGVSPVTVDDVEASVPPNLAAAASLVAQVAASTAAGRVAAGSLHTLLNPSVALALTSE